MITLVNGGNERWIIPGLTIPFSREVQSAIMIVEPTY